METLKKNRNMKTSLLDAAQELMLEKGYVATSVDEICKKASTTKGSFFHYFSNKEALGIELTERFTQNTLDVFSSICLEAGDDPLDRVFAIMDLAVSLTQDPQYKGCLVGTFTQELSKTHTRINDVCGAFVDQLTNLLKENFKSAIEKYSPNKTINLNDLVGCLISILQGSIIVMKAKSDFTLMEKNLLQFKQYVKLLFEK